MKFALLTVLMYYMNQGDLPMQELITFFKDIFTLKDSSNNRRIGLCSFKDEKPAEKPRKLVLKASKDVKISDLMRRSA